MRFVKMAKLEKHFVLISLIIGIFNKIIYFYAELILTR